MNDLKRQVRLAHRRLQLQQFFNWLPWTLTATLLVALLAVAATKLWALPVQSGVWSAGWIFGGIALGIMAAVALTYMRGSDQLTAAIEIDERYGLKERVSSCLALTEAEQQTESGRALIDDAIRRVAQVDVGDRFGVTTTRWAIVPCTLAVLAFGLTLLSDAQPDPSSSQAVAAVSKKEKKTVANSTQKLIKKSEQLKRQAAEKGLQDASDLFKRLEAGVDSLKAKENVDRKQAMVKLNDLAKAVQERQRELLSRDSLRKQLNALKDIKSGPADRMAKAMKQGDFQTALDEVKKLQEALRDNKLSEAEKQAMAEQLEQLKDKLQEMVNAQQNAKSQLEEQIKRKIAQGDRAAANKLQNQLDQLMQQQQQMKKMSELAQKMGQAAQAMKDGKGQQAAQQLSEMAEGLEAMQAELAEMELLEEAIDQIASAKDSMNCASCEGMGCAMCQSMGSMGMGGMGSGMGEGDGLGEGQGRGDRPEEETGFGTYDSQVRAKPGKGRAITTGTAFGANRPGQALEEIKIAIEAAEQGQDDPLTGQRLPKPQRELTREYFGAMTGE